MPGGRTRACAAPGGVPTPRWSGPVRCPSTWSRGVFPPPADASVCMLSVMIFFWMVVTAAIVGGLTYAIVLRPWVGLYVVGPLVGMFVVSLIVATRVSRRNASPDEPIVHLP